MTAPLSGAISAPFLDALLHRFAAAGSVSAGLTLLASALPAWARPLLAGAAARSSGFVLCAWSRWTHRFPIGGEGWELIFEPLGSGVLAAMAATVLVLGEVLVGQFAYDPPRHRRLRPAFRSVSRNKSARAESKPREKRGSMSSTPARLAVKKSPPSEALRSLGQALVLHWPEYTIEAAGLGVFMISACLFGTWLSHPASALNQALPDPLQRRVVMGLVMGLTAIAIIYSRWGKRSGAHINPAVTLAFLRLGKVDPRDAFFYVLAQFLGGLGGVLISAAILGDALAHPAVVYVTTRPGAGGAVSAFGGELAISFLLLLAVLVSSNSLRWARYTGLIAGALVASYIALEEPLSGMSMNPARTFASAAPAGVWTGLWVYFLAPPLGMLAAAELYRWIRRAEPVWCAKYRHPSHQESTDCIFRCNYPGCGS